jgi:hypothetical protein
VGLATPEEFAMIALMFVIGIMSTAFTVTEGIRRLNRVLDERASRRRSAVRLREVLR